MDAGRKYLAEMGFKKEASDDKCVMDFLNKTKSKEGMEYFQKMAAFDWDTIKGYMGSAHDWMNKNMWQRIGVENPDIAKALSGAVGVGVPTALLGGLAGGDEDDEEDSMGRMMRYGGLGAALGAVSPYMWNTLFGGKKPYSIAKGMRPKTQEWRAGQKKIAPDIRPTGLKTQ